LAREQLARADGGFFAMVLTVVGMIFEIARVSAATGMLVIEWTEGYRMMSRIDRLLKNVPRRNQPTHTY